MMTTTFHSDTRRASVDDLKRSTRIADLVPGLKKSGAYHVGPCPFCGGEDRFNVKTTDRGDEWLCRHCTPDHYHDAVDFLMRSTGRTFAEVVGGKAGKVVARPTAPAPAAVDAPVDLATAPTEEWQIAGLIACAECADSLHGDTPDARAVWQYLTGARPKTNEDDGDRCLLPETIFRAGLGFNPARRTLANGCTLPRGITIPRAIDGTLWSVNVRRPNSEMQADRARGIAKPRKYAQLSGRGDGVYDALYGADEMIVARSVFVTEGEFDALVLRQYVPPEVAVVTMGAAGYVPGVSWLAYFAVPRDILLVLDNDEPGRAALAKWRQLLPRARSVQLPDASKDVTDFRRGGGNLVQWAYSTLHALDV